MSYKMAERRKIRNSLKISELPKRKKPVTFEMLPVSHLTNVLYHEYTLYISTST